MFKRLKLSGACALLLAAVAAVVQLAAQYISPEGAGAAQMLRRVQLEEAKRFDPVVVTKIMLGDTVVQKGRFAKPRGEVPDPTISFAAGDDWVQNVSIYLLNRTDKVIAYQLLSVDFPDTFVGNTGLFVTLPLGAPPPAFAFNRNGTPSHQPPGAQPLSWGPHETIAVHLRDHTDAIRASTGPEGSLATQSRMGVLLSVCYFADGMGWFSQYMTWDRENSKWQVVDRNDGPVNPDSFWPGQPGWSDPL